MLPVFLVSLLAIASGLGGVFCIIQMIAGFKTSLKTAQLRANDADYCSQNSNWKVQEYCSFVASYTFGVLVIVALLGISLHLSFLAYDYSSYS